MKVTDLMRNEFRKFYDTLKSDVMATRIVGRGKRSHYRPIYVLLTSVVTIKYGESWDQLDKLFHIKGLTHMKLTAGFLEKQRDFMVQRFVTKF